MGELLNGLREALDLIWQMDASLVEVVYLSLPVSYTHLTLPTKRIV